MSLIFNLLVIKVRENHAWEKMLGYTITMKINGFLWTVYLLREYFKQIHSSSVWEEAAGHERPPNWMVLINSTLLGSLDTYS